MSSLNPGFLFCFGLGYSARYLARDLLGAGWRVEGTCRDGEKKAALAKEGITAHLFGAEVMEDSLRRALAEADHVLVSIPPNAEVGDPVLHMLGDVLVDMDGLRWLGYLSTTGVYGDRAGAEVDEESKLQPTSDRAARRVQAEQEWLEMHGRFELPVHIFRLAGIYGPGRSQLDQVRTGKARRIRNPGHKFSRIHVADIARVLKASMAKPEPGRVYNVCDNEPAEPADVVAYACELLNRPEPEEIPFETAQKDMSEMARSFWRDNKTVSNRRIKEELGVDLAYPTYREGLKAIYDEES